MADLDGWNSLNRRHIPKDINYSNATCFRHFEINCMQNLKYYISGKNIAVCRISGIIQCRFSSLPLELSTLTLCLQTPIESNKTHLKANKLPCQYGSRNSIKFNIEINSKKQNSMEETQKYPKLSVLLSCSCTGLFCIT